MSDLSILCVTHGGEYGKWFRWNMTTLASALDAEMVFAADRCYDTLEAGVRDVVVKVESQGYIESILDVAVEACTGKYVLRLDDDEAASPAMVQWLKDGLYHQADHWCFPRFHFWGSKETVLVTPPFFPDWQTRLSVKEKAGGRPKVHAASPFGMGAIATVGIEHYELLIKTQEERAILAKKYYEVAGITISMEEAMGSQPEAWPKTQFQLRKYSTGAISLKEIQ